MTRDSGTTAGDSYPRALSKKEQNTYRHGWSLSVLRVTATSDQLCGLWADLNEVLLGSMDFNQDLTVFHLKRHAYSIEIKMKMNMTPEN